MYLSGISTNALTVLQRSNKYCCIVGFKSIKTIIWKKTTIVEEQTFYCLQTKKGVNSILSLKWTNVQISKLYLSNSY